MTPKRRRCVDQKGFGRMNCQGNWNFESHLYLLQNIGGSGGGGDTSRYNEFFHVSFSL